MSRRAVVPVVVVTVKVETRLPAEVTVTGAKLQVAFAGRPEQENVTVEVEENPFWGVNVTVSVPLFPAVTVRDGEETAKVKFGALLLVLLAVTVRVALLLVVEPSALATTTLKSAPLSVVTVAGVV